MPKNNIYILEIAPAKKYFKANNINLKPLYFMIADYLILPILKPKYCNMH